MKSFLVCIALVVSVPMSAWQPGPEAKVALATVLARAGTYVQAFEKQLSGIVAEESYLQVTSGTMRTGIGTQSGILNKRVLKSDFLLVLLEGADRYLEFRDVFEVDGQPVRGREDRLSKLFLQPPARREAQAQAIIDESARYNIGRIARTMNTPMLAMMFLRPSLQWRFRFKETGKRRPAIDAPTIGRNDNPTRFRVSAEVWVVEFRETERKTVIRTPGGGDFPASGRFWIDPATGAVLITELVMHTPNLEAIVNVSYQSEPLLGFRVPVEMRESYVTRNERLDSMATYGRFRQFQVKTDQEIKTPEDPSAKPPVKPPPPGGW